MTSVKRYQRWTRTIVDERAEAMLFSSNETA